MGCGAYYLAAASFSWQLLACAGFTYGFLLAGLVLGGLGILRDNRKLVLRACVCGAAGYLFYMAFPLWAVTGSAADHGVLYILYAAVHMGVCLLAVYALSAAWEALERKTKPQRYLFILYRILLGLMGLELCLYAASSLLAADTLGAWSAGTGLYLLNSLALAVLASLPLFYLHNAVSLSPQGARPAGLPRMKYMRLLVGACFCLSCWPPSTAK